MRLALLRHGIAEDAADSDFDRALTDEGHAGVIAQIERIADQGWRPGAILHSPLVRTTQTARHLHARFPDVPMVSLEALALGFYDPILRAAAGATDPVLVGHEPTMGNLCARLIGAPTGAIRFERAGFALLDVDRLPSTRPARLLLFLPPPRRYLG